MKESHISIENIKSIYILKRIVSLLLDIKKLDLIKFNRQLQNKLFVNLEDYTNASYKYKIIENNGMGKEYYNNGELLYIGEYSKGKRNGKGKEYDTYGKLIFEGEYLNGKKISGTGYDNKGNKTLILKNGKGREYYKNGRIKFIGEYYDGRRWKGKLHDNELNKNEIKYGLGKVKEYNYYGELIFEGEYLNGKKNWKSKRIL